jgi:hypothetical protein
MVWVLLGLGLAIDSAAADAGDTWRSRLYPADWTPGQADAEGRFLHDFSYAGYRRGEVAVPDAVPGPRVVVRADRTGRRDATGAIQAALDRVGEAGGGTVLLPAGTYRVAPPDGQRQRVSLRMRHSNVVLRGEGAGRTFLFNASPRMRYGAVIQVAPDPGPGNAPVAWQTPAGEATPLAADTAGPTMRVQVGDASAFEVGDWVVIRTDVTEAFVADHRMQAFWGRSDAARQSLHGQMYYRRVTGIDASNGALHLDIPTRYPLLRRDKARVYRVAPHLEGVGIEDLAIGMEAHPGEGWGEQDYHVAGRAAYDAHQSHAIDVRHCVDGWVRRVHSYAPAGNPKDRHLLSNGIRLFQSRGITVARCIMANPSYLGGGGNGYGFTLQGSDCLLQDNVAVATRHNFSFKSLWATGNVIHGGVSRDGDRVSDFHQHMSIANLVDNLRMEGDSFETRVRPAGGAARHGVTATQSVFWNLEGVRGNRRTPDRVVLSRQHGWGYVIGTRGPVSRVVVEPTIDHGVDTSPRDIVEGQGRGEGLEPASLYVDQLQRRAPRSNASALSSQTRPRLTRPSAQDIDELSIGTYK